ncbi:receptor-transporting protein 4 [Bombina bombina]|uniref:receptor-transporting protein 4 n=1 Tax=Bombina bombina TaxID=8345 RepID=UPI00235AF6B5|nr:receptor-transporting protein 4 [Bombina bombina]
MDETSWRDEFDSKIEEIQVPHKWNLSVDSHLKQEKQGWLLYTQCTFARFTCSHCRRWWNSAEVHILFAIKLDGNGIVKMRIFRQECKRCNNSVMEKPEITYENLKRVISNLVNRIKSKIYRQSNGNEDLKSVIYSDKIEGPHDKAHCEACKHQVCQWQIIDEEQQSPSDLQEPSTDWPRPPAVIPLPPPPHLDTASFSPPTPRRPSVIPLPPPAKPSTPSLSPPTAQRSSVIPLPPPTQPSSPSLSPPTPRRPSVIPLPPPPHLDTASFSPPTPRRPSVIPLPPPTLSSSTVLLPSTTKPPLVIPLPPPVKQDSAVLLSPITQLPLVISLPPTTKSQSVMPLTPPSETPSVVSLPPPTQKSPENNTSEDTLVLGTGIEGLFI